MTQLWLLKTEWDEVVPPSLLHQWLNFKEELIDICHIRIPRKLCSDFALEKPSLHIFCDASQQAYGCCAYLSSNQHGRYASSLICSKSKVAPLEVISVPKLELCSAVLGAELGVKLLSELQVVISSINFWTDSKVVLAWITQPPHKWKTFVANRVAKIQECTSTIDWNYVSTELNPADIITRGCSLAQLATHKLYWHGPEWLCQPMTFSPSVIEEEEEVLEIPEAKIQDMVLTAHVIPQFKETYSRFSNYNRLIRIIARIVRWRNRIKD